MITIATKNGLQRPFSEQQWKDMPKDKYGWVPIGSEDISGKPMGSNTTPDEIIQKKIVQGKVVDVVKNIPEELKAKPKTKKNDTGTKE